MANKKILWEPQESEQKTPHSILIKTFIEKYIIEQKQIFPRPNPYLLKMDIMDGRYLTGNYSDIIPSFEKIVLYAKGPLSAKDAPLNHSYMIDVLGDYEERESLM